MAKITGLKKKLISTNPCPNVWLEKNGRYPDCEVGFVRAFYDGWYWCGNYFDVNPEVSNKLILDELGQVYSAFQRSFKDLRAMTKWCIENAEPDGGRYSSFVAGNWFNAWYIGKEGIYWLRMMTGKGDYNLYIHCLDRKLVKEVSDNG